MPPSTTIDPIQPDDLPELSRFLCHGFQLPVETEVMAPDVLRWKYLDSGDSTRPRSFIARSGPDIIGHIGLCPQPFRVLGTASLTVPSVHFMDWLAREGGAPIGLTLIQQGFRDYETQYVVAPGDQGLQVTARLGYTLACEVGSFQTILNPLYRRRLAEYSRLGGHLRAVKDLWRYSRQYEAVTASRVVARPVPSFGAELTDLLNRVNRPVALVGRSPEHMNNILRYPRPGNTGWLLESQGQTIGFAVLRVAMRSGVAEGKLIDCFLVSEDDPLWQEAVSALVAELKAQRADVVSAYASNPRLWQALERNGFALIRKRPFLLRDPKRKLPRDIPFHMTQLEADLAYL